MRTGDRCVPADRASTQCRYATLPRRAGFFSSLLDPEGVLIKADALHTKKPFSAAQSAGSRLPADSESKPEEALPPDRQPVSGKAAHPF